MKKKTALVGIVIIITTGMLWFSVASKNEVRVTYETDRVNMELYLLNSSAKLYFDNNGSFVGFCTSEEVNSFKTHTEERASEVVYCHETGDTFELKAKIGAPYNTEKCIDQTGYFGECV